MQPFRIFIIEDDTWYAEILKYYLSLNPDYEIELFSSGAEALKNLHKKPDVITLDYSLPDMDGVEVLRKIKATFPDLPVIIVSAQEEIGVAVDLLKEGAYDYILKNEETKDRLWKVMLNVREHVQLKNDHEALQTEVKKKYEFQNVIIGESPLLKKVFAMVDKVNRSNITVSISGETGTGKEVIAKAIHYSSPQAAKPFVAVNISAIPAGLLESELFGHEKGAFTGAVNRHIGKFEQAHKGTLFLDEIAEMDMAGQSKLLRVLQERELVRVGGTQTIKIETRVIVATHKNLAEEVRKGNFREDLFYRLMGVPLELPPLRERGKDIALLAKHFMSLFCNENKMNLPKLTPPAVSKMMQYRWPGNVRELKAVMDLAVIMADNQEIRQEHIIFNQTSKMDNLIDEETTLENYEFRIVRHFMEKYDNKAILVAQKLGISKSTIYRMLKKMDYTI